MSTDGLPQRLGARVFSNGPAGGVGLRLRLAVGSAWPVAQPGRFVMLSPGARGAAPRFDPLLPRPMAIYRTEGEGEARTLDVLYEVVGRGTALLAEAKRGDVVDVVGPLGRGFAPLGPGDTAILVGGGTGIASLYDLAARADGATLRVLLGARSAERLLGVADFRALGVPLEVATDDGSEGHHGLVTELLERALAELPDARVHACGPTPMMRRASEIAGPACRVSLENRMACGYGVCLGCAVPRAEGGFALVCRDGPVFESGALAWAGIP